MLINIRSKIHSGGMYESITAAGQTDIPLAPLSTSKATSKSKMTAIEGYSTPSIFTDSCVSDATLEEYKAVNAPSKNKATIVQKFCTNVRGIISSVSVFAGKHPHAVSIATNLLAAVYNPVSGAMSIAGSSTNAVIKSAESLPSDNDGQNSRIITKIASFLKTHSTTAEVITALVSVTLQVSIGIALCAAPIFILFKVLDISYDALTNILAQFTPIKKFIEAHPVAAKITAATISVALQVSVGALTGAWPIVACSIACKAATTVLDMELSNGLISAGLSKIIRKISPQTKANKISDETQAAPINPEGVQVVLAAGRDLGIATTDTALNSCDI